MEDIISRFNEDEDNFAYDLVQEIRMNKGIVNDVLLNEVKCISSKLDDPEYEVPISFYYSVFLLAEFRDKRLMDLLIELFSRYDVDYFDCLGGNILDCLSRIVNSVFDGDFDRIDNIIIDKNIDCFVRGKLLKCYIYFYDQKMISKEYLIGYLRGLIDFFIGEHSDIYNFIMDVVIYTHLVEMADDFKKLYELDYIDYNILGGYDRFVDYVFGDNTTDESGVVELVENEMSWWWCFNKSKYNYSNVGFEKDSEK